MKRSSLGALVFAVVCGFSIVASAQQDPCSGPVHNPNCPSNPPPAADPCNSPVYNPLCGQAPQPGPETLFTPYRYKEVNTWGRNELTGTYGCGGSVTIYTDNNNEPVADFEDVGSGCSNVTVWARPGSGQRPFKYGSAHLWPSTTNPGTNHATISLRAYFQNNLRKVSFKLSNPTSPAIGNVVTIQLQ